MAAEQMLVCVTLHGNRDLIETFTDTTLEKIRVLLAVSRFNHAIKQRQGHFSGLPCFYVCCVCLICPTVYKTEAWYIKGLSCSLVRLN